MTSRAGRKEKRHRLHATVGAIAATCLCAGLCAGGCLPVPASTSPAATASVERTGTVDRISSTSTSTTETATPAVTSELATVGLSSLPPGQYLAYMKGGDHPSIHLRSTETDVDVPIATDVGMDAAIDPSSASLVYTFLPSGDPFSSNGLLRATDLNGGVLLEIPTGKLASPRWSPDGTMVTATIGDVLAIVHLDGREPSVIVDCSGLQPPGEWSCGGGVWSPDGRRIAYGRSISGAGAPHPEAGIYILENDQLLDGSGEWRRAFGPLTGSIFGAYGWSPDSRYLAFATRQGIEIFDADEGKVVRDVRLEFIPESLVWTPDGMGFATSASGYLLIVDAETGTVEYQKPDLGITEILGWIALPLAAK